jgi:hypothetical protein
MLYQSNRVRNDSQEFMTDISSKLEAKIGQLNAQEQQDILDALDANTIKEASDAWAVQIKDSIAYDRVSFNKLKGTDIETPLDKNDLANWFISDVSELSKRYADIHLPKIELEKKFGTANLNELKKPIIAELEAAKVANPKKAAALQREFESIDKDLKSIFENITNERNFSKSAIDTAVNNVGKLASASKLGSALISSLTDYGKLITINGVSKVFKHSLESLVDRSDLGKLSKDEMTELSFMLDDIMHNRTNSVAGIIDKYTDDGVVSKSINWISDKSMRASLLPHWTKKMKVQAGYIASEKIVTVGNKLLKNSKVSENDLIDLAKVGLDKPTLMNIAEQYNKHGENRRMNISNWDDLDTTQAFKEGLSRYVDKTINTPSAGDIPRLMQTPIGRILFQFQSFAVLNWNQFIIAGLQRPDANFLTSVAGISGLAYLQLRIKEKLNGTKLPTHWDGMDGIAAKIVDEAGLVSGITVGYDKMASLVPGASRDELFGGNKQMLQRTTPSDRVVKFLGPSAGYLKDAVTSITPMLTEKDYEGSELRATRNMLPFQNNWWLKGLFNHLELEIGKGLDINNVKPRKDSISTYLREELQ